ncbi:hypothetical protein D3C86_2170530 [compost metagenome]
MTDFRPGASVTARAAVFAGAKLPKSVACGPNGIAVCEVAIAMGAGSSAGE